jgi:3',5'-cyclic AMP phosphodiesterase CpdA
MLDSMVPAAPGDRIDHGLLTVETLDFLDDQLRTRARGERAFVCLHHPPEPIHLDLMDPIRLRNSGDLAGVLDRHRNVVAVLVGHAHSACTTSFASMSAPIPILIPGGIASTVTLDAEPFQQITPELPPTFAIHFVDDEGRITTHWRSLEMGL